MTRLSMFTRTQHAVSAESVRNQAAMSATSVVKAIAVQPIIVAATNTVHPMDMVETGNSNVWQIQQVSKQKKPSMFLCVPASPAKRPSQSVSYYALCVRLMDTW